MIPIQDAKRFSSQAETSYYVEVCDICRGRAQNADNR
jgi:hypothetical protein